MKVQKLLKKMNEKKMDQTIPFEKKNKIGRGRPKTKTDEELKESQRRWYEQNKDYKKAYQKNYYETVIKGAHVPDSSHAETKE